MSDIEWKHVRPVVYASAAGVLGGNLTAHTDTATAADWVVWLAAMGWLVHLALSAARRMA